MNNVKDVKVGSQTFLFQRLSVGSVFWKITWKTTFIKNQFSLSHVYINNHPRNMKFPLGFEDNTNSLCCCSVFKSNATLCNSMDCRTPGLPVLHHLLSLLKLMSIELVMPSNHLILCHHLLLLPSIFPSIRIFSNESALHIRWPKY